MPLVEITLRRGFSPETIAAIGEAVHGALVAEANVPADDRFQIFHSVERDHLNAHPTYGGVSRSDAPLIVKITLNAGRTVEIKKKLYAEIARRLETAAAIRPDDVVVCLVEVAKENWSFGGGRATYA
jgi:4-oxalocrotonate tautomerase